MSIEEGPKKRQPMIIKGLGGVGHMQSDPTYRKLFVVKGTSNSGILYWPFGKMDGENEDDAEQDE